MKYFATIESSEVYEAESEKMARLSGPGTARRGFFPSTCSKAQELFLWFVRPSGERSIHLLLESLIVLQRCSSALKRLASQTA
jgi:hypothetical protein